MTGLFGMFPEEPMTIGAGFHGATVSIEIPVAFQRRDKTELLAPAGFNDDRTQVVAVK